jgi:4-cresol dehydrogenase (hydroxylating)
MMAIVELPTEDVDATPLDQRLAHALDAWSRSIGDAHVQATKETCERYGRSTSPWSQEPIAVLRPSKVAEVQEIVRIARQFRIPLYPISGGKNWGMGDACPTTPGQVVVDLRRLNAIREVNLELGYAVIEAGVTQRQLFEHLRDHAPSWSLDVTGAGPNATIVGNIMERGFGHTPYGDRFHNSCNYEVILADGEMLRTGFGQFDNSRSAHVLKAGLGPLLDGVFTQSNLGIVTSLTVWLLPKPRQTEAFAFTVADDSCLPDIIDALRPLRLSGVLPSTVHIANDLRVISSKSSFPYALTGGTVPLSDRDRAMLRAQYGVGAWNVLGGLYGPPSMIRGARQELTRALRGIALPRFINDSRLNWATRITSIGRKIGLFRRLDAQLKSATAAFNLLNGEPVAEHLQGTAWRNRRGASGNSPNDPLENGDGLIWLSPTLPMTGRDAEQVKQTAERILRQFGFDLLATFVSISGRAMCCPITICFDRESAHEHLQATKCYNALAKEMFDAGYQPYRLATQAMKYMGNQTNCGVYSLVRVKQAFDEYNLIAPGRYISA